MQANQMDVRFRTRADEFSYGKDSAQRDGIDVITKSLVSRKRTCDDIAFIKQDYEPEDCG